MRYAALPRSRLAVLLLLHAVPKTLKICTLTFSSVSNKKDDDYWSSVETLSSSSHLVKSSHSYNTW